ncbi:MAG TPA: hypothetical protein VH186_21115 [Chloroflexia bacterium]|nr:hypothetical protein [Chloroflexia bacterium]
MKLKVSVLALAMLLLSAIFVTPFSVSAAAPSRGSVTQPVTGTYAGGTFAGAYTITRFVKSNGQIYGVGTLSGTLTDALGNTQSVTNVAVSVPVTAINGQSLTSTAAASTNSAAAPAAAGSCTILDLTLGPLHLNLLGLVVDLNQVNLNITAQQGSGNLLGNLLCAVANLLNGGSPLSNLLNGLTNLLNQILGQL